MFFGGGRARATHHCAGEADVVKLADGMVGKLAADTQNASLRIKVRSS